MNINKCCIETQAQEYGNIIATVMNINKCCIETKTNHQ